MKKRNKYLESDGLFFESETHEWFHDKSNTAYAQKENASGIKLPTIHCFVVYAKETEEYDRVVMDEKTNEIVYSTKRLEDLGFWIDIQKIIKGYDDEKTKRK